MATGRERDDAIRRAEDRIRHRRESQSGQQGRGRPDESLFRHSGLVRPGDPSGGDRPIDVNVVGNSEVMAGMRSMTTTGARGTEHHAPHSIGPQRFGANINTPQAQVEAGNQIAREMKLQVEAAQQLAKASTEHLETMKRIYDQERDAVEELTEVLRQGARVGVGGGAGPESPAGGSSSPGRGTRPAGPRSSGHEPAGGREHYDPAGLLGDGPIHGGRRNSQIDLMRHIAMGGSPETFDQSAYMTPGRNHPTSYGELNRNLRVRAARAVNRRFGEPSIPSLDPQYDEQGNLSHYLHDMKDGSTPQRVEPGQQAQDLAHNISTGYAGARMASRVAGAVAEGGIGAGIKAIPVLGTAVAVADGVNKIAEWTTEQRAANAPYQAIEGGTNFGTGFSERFSKFGHRMGERFAGGMTGDQSDQLFDSLTGMGFTGNRRESYFQEASQNYKQYGMDPTQSAQLINVAARSFNTNMVNVAESLRTVTNAAIATGQNADQARQQFIANAEQLSASGMKGNALFSTAAADTAAVTELGRGMQGVNFTGMNNEMTNRLEAAQSGMSYGRFMARRENDGSVGTRAQDRLVGQYSAPYIGGQVGSDLQRKIAENGGKDAVARNPDLQRKIANELMDEDNVDASGLARQLQQAGVSGVDPNDPASALVVGMQETMHGGQWFTQKERESEAQHAQRGLNPEEAKAARQSTMPGRLTDLVTPGGMNRKNPYSSTGLTRLKDDVLHGVIGGLDLNPFDSYTSDGGDESDSRFVNLQQEQKTGKKDQTIDQLLDPAKGISGDSNTGVKVKTKDGDKVVPLNTAITKYRDQVAKGTATIVGGDNDGKSVKDITNGAEGNYQGPDSTGAEASDDAQSVEDWKKDHGSDSSGGGSGSDVKVTVEPGPSLQNWFKFNTGNGGQTETGAATGSPTQPGGLPNGGSGTP